MPKKALLLAMGLVISAAIGMVACLFDSRGPGQAAPLRYALLGDTAAYSSDPDFASLPSDSGYAVAWRSTQDYPSTQSIVVQRMDARGESVSRSYTNYAKTAYLSEPRLSAYPDGGLVCVWSAAEGVVSGGVVVVKLLRTGSGLPYPIELAMPGFLTMEHVNVLALPDSGYLIGVEVQTRSGDSIWTGRFGPDGRTVGPVWAKAERYLIHSLEFEPRQGGGWFAFWAQTGLSAQQNDSVTVHWQAFDAEGKTVGAERERQLVRIDVSRPLRTQALGGGRILVQIRNTLGVPSDLFVLSPEG